jgi:uncharacterized protein (TIRG00374 family)
MAGVIWWVGPDKVLRGIAAIRPVWIVPILATAYLGMAISCLRWQALLAARGVRVSVHRLIFYYTIGYFFSSFLPGLFGGDIARSYVFGKKIENQLESFASVFMERLTGLAGLVGVAFVATILNYRTIREAGLVPFMGAIFGGFCLFLVLLFNRPLVERAGACVRWRRVEAWKKKLLLFHDAVCSFRSMKRTVALALFYSVLFQFLTSVNTWIVCLALNLDVRFLDIMVVIPIILLICTVPSTPGATGIWEIAFTVFFSRLGIPEAGAANIALVLRAKNILVAMLGGVLYALPVGRPRRDGDG